MSKKVIKNIAGLFLIIAVIILSLDIHSLDSERRIPASEVFDVDAYVEDFWKNRLPGRLADAVDIEYLVQLLKNDPDEAFDNYSNKLGISNTHYFYISGTGKVDSAGEESVLLTIGDEIQAELETTYVFGNAIRDGSGLVDIDEFLNMMDFNMVSVYINRKAKSEVAEPFRKEVGPGMTVRFTGAAEINRLHGVTEPLSIIPIRISLDHGE